MQKILIIQTAYIGDVILATSLIKKIATLDPEAQIDFLLRSGNESLLANTSSIKNLYIWDKKKKYSSLFKIVKQIRRQKYDAVINVQRFFNSGLMTVLSGAKLKIGFDKNPLSIFFHHKIKHLIPHKIKDGSQYHEVQRNAQLLVPLFKNYFVESTEKLSLELEFSQKDESVIKSLLEGVNDYLVIAPSSVWFTKQFPENKWKEFLPLIPKELVVFYIGAPADREFIEQIKPKHDQHINVAGNLSLLQSALLMRGAKRVFVNDSAPLHLASAVNAKTTAIFCSTISAFGYYPLSDDSILIQERQNLSCRPCGLHGKKECPLTHFKCAQTIEVKRLLESIDYSKS